MCIFHIHATIYRDNDFAYTKACVFCIQFYMENCMQISLCMIVKDEEDTLGNCLESIADLVDEIIIVDTGSSDNTIQVAEKYTKKIYHFAWEDDFAKARNFAFSKASKDYVMWLDADDIILAQDRIKFQQLKEKLDGKIPMVVCKYNMSTMQNIQEITLSYYRERIFLREMHYQWVGAIHEVISIAPEAMYSDFAVTHHKIHATEKGRNLRIFEKMRQSNQTFDLRQLFYYGRELYFNERYADALLILDQVIQNDAAWVENRIDACLISSHCLSVLKREKEAMQALLNSFLFAVPRGEVCCEMARFFSRKNLLQEAIYWYEVALKTPPPLDTGAFVQMDCYTYLPCIELCVLYYKLGDLAKAKAYNQKAGKYKPKDPAYLYNKKFFATLQT